MAEQEEEKTDGEEKKPGGGKIKLIIIAVAVLLLVGGSVLGTLFFFGVFEGDETTEAADEAATGEQLEVRQEAIYFPIKPPFIINFQARGRQRFLQVSVTVMSREMAAIDAVQAHLPLVKNRLVMLFSGEVYEELHTDEGRELLRQKALMAIQEILQQEIGSRGVEQVLFENFVMQ